MPHLSISLLGSFQVTLDGQPVTGFKSDKVRALLAYVAVEADRPHRREVLAGLLWPEMPDRPARSNLRDALASLRKAIGDRDAIPPFLAITRETIQFNTSGDYWLDVAAFTDLAEPTLSLAKDPGDVPGLEKAIALYGGGFLEGFSVGDSIAFEEWALFTRERLARQMSSALHRLSATYEQRGEYEQAKSWAWRQIELEPWDEAAHQQLMRTLALSGHRSAALAQYKSCCRILAEELGVEPAIETTRLYEQIRDGRLKVPVSHVARAPVAAAEPLPFLIEKGPDEVERAVFVARERELAQLAGFLALALAGQGRVVLVTGETGSGKTALVQEFLRRAQDADSSLVVASGNCDAHIGIGDPYLPLREILGLLTGDVEARWAAGAMTREQARRLWHALPLTAQALVQAGPDLIGSFVSGTALVERAMAYAPGGADWLAELDELVTRRALSPVVPAAGQSDLFQQYSRVLQTLARQVPLVLVVEDLQWADAGAISLLSHMGRQLAGSRMLIVGAYRPEEVALGRDGARHPLEPVVNAFQREFGNIAVNVDQAESRDFAEAYLDSEPNRLGRPFREMLYQQTRGHALFTIELLRGMQERGDLVQDPEGRWVEGRALDWETLPARVEAAIAERIERLVQPFRAALRVASVEGVDFTAEVVARVLGMDEREMVQRLSRQLDRRHRLVRALAIERMGSRRVSRYRFRHFLFQKYLYDRLDPVERAYLHEDVGNVLEELFGGQTAEIAAIAPQLARHFREARIAEKAIHYLRQAGERAVQLCAYQEGIAHLTTGLALLMDLPESLKRDQKELALQLALGMAWAGQKGMSVPEVEKTYARARALCQKLGQTSQLCRVLSELSFYHYVRAEHQRALQLGEEALSLAECAKDALLVAVGHWCLGVFLFCLGDYTTARAHLGQVIAFYDPQQHHRSLVFLRGSDAGLSALAYDACCLWCLGYPEQALKRSQEALALARELDHSFSLADVLSFAGCMFNEMRRDAQTLKEHAEELMQLSNERAPAWSGTGSQYRGEALVMLGQVQEGIAQIRESIATREARGVRLYLPATLCCLAEAHAKAGHPEEGLTTLAKALALVENTHERHWEAELYRLRAELLLIQGDDVEAEGSFHKAIKVARRQRAKSWELRAGTGLAHLWQQQGRTDEARQLLAPIYGWFTEGFDTPDLKAAKALLRELT